LYAVIRAGGRQYKVAEGDVIEVERIKDSSDTVEFVPLLVVDDDGGTHSGKDALAGSRVQGRILSQSKGPKLDVYKFRNKTGYRRHTGHRQRYTSVEIASISLEARKSGGAAKSGGATKKKGSNDGT
jgi:large subunit ribosomal protein L21